MQKNLTSADVGRDIKVNGIISYEFAKSKSGTAYLKGTIRDAATNYYFNIFNGDIVKKISVLPNNSGVLADAVIEAVRTNEKTSNVIKIKNIEASFVGKAITDTSSMRKLLVSEYEKISDSNLKAIIQGVLKKAPAYLTAPYGFNSFNYKGGLLAYMCAMLLAFDSLEKAGFTSTCSADYIRCGIMLHRIGKTATFEMEKDQVVKTEIGKFLEDGACTITIAYPIIDNSKLAEFDKIYLKSIIGSTKAKMAWGSTSEMTTKEAYIIHYIEQLVLIDGEFNALNEINNGNFVKGNFGRVIYQKETI